MSPGPASAERDDTVDSLHSTPVAERASEPGHAVDALPADHFSLPADRFSLPADRLFVGQRAKVAEAVSSFLVGALG